MRNDQRIYLWLIIFLVHLSCKDQVYNPKPRTYPRVELEEKHYNPYVSKDCPFRFNIPSYATFENDSTFFDTLAGPCWFNINFAKMNAKVYCTYKSIHKKDDLTQSINEAYRFVKSHLIRADYIDEYPLRKLNHVSGIIYEIEGPSATPFQFYLTDSIQHFVRGALYFNTHINPDSLKPYYDFAKADVMEMINSFSWK